MAQVAKKNFYTRKLAEEKAEYKVSAADYETKIKAVHETEAKLEKARSHLKKHRRPPHVDNDGGVYFRDDHPKSSAPCLGTGFMAMLSLLGAMLM